MLADGPDQGPEEGPGLGEAGEIQQEQYCLFIRVQTVLWPIHPESHARPKGLTGLREVEIAMVADVVGKCSYTLRLKRR